MTLTMPFGKYKGQAFDTVPAWYADWLRKQDWLHGQYPAVAAFFCGEDPPQAEDDDERSGAARPLCDVQGVVAEPYVHVKGSGPYRRAECPGCGRDVAVYPNGRIAVHAQPDAPSPDTSPATASSEVPLVARAGFTFLRLTGDLPLRARTACVLCGGPLTVNAGAIHPVWLISSEVVGAVHDHHLAPDDRRRLDDFRSGRRRLVGEQAVQP